jgi:autotransporter-associated beta strand protein
MGPNSTLTCGAAAAGENMNAFSGQINLAPVLFNGLASAGTFRFNSGATVNTGSPTAGFNLGGVPGGVAGGAILNCRNNGTINLGELRGGPFSVLGGSRSTAGTTFYSVGGLNTSTTFYGIVSNFSSTDLAGLAKVGSGNLTLTGINYGATGGPLVISGGELIIGDGNADGTLTATPVTVTSPGALVFNRPDNIVITNGISGTGAVILTGGGAVGYAGGTNWTGPTLVSNGDFVLAEGNLVTGSIYVGPNSTFDDSQSPFVFNQTLSGSGTVINPAVGVYPFTVSLGGVIAPASPTGGAATLSIVNGLSETGGAVNTLSLSTPAGANDLIQVTGNVSFSGVNSLLLSGFGGVAPANGVYPLITYTGTLTGSAANFLVEAIGFQAVVTNITTTTPKSIAVIVSPASRPPANLVWSGAGGPNWDSSTVSWLSSGSPVTFLPGDSVLFSDAGANPTVNLAAPLLLPIATVVSNNAEQYTFTGGGQLTGPFSVTKLNSGVLTILNTNSYTGPTLIRGGVLEVTNINPSGINSAIGAASSAPANLVVSNGTFRYSGPSAILDHGIMTLGSGGLDVTNVNTFLTNNGLVTGSGTFVKTGAGTLVVAGDNSYVGGTVISNGEIYLAANNANNFNGTVSAFGATNTPVTFQGANGILSLYGGDINTLSGPAPGFGSQANYYAATFNSFYNPLVVPAGQSGTLIMYPRTTGGTAAVSGLLSTLTGAGTMNVEVNYVRSWFSGDWSAFTGTINVISVDPYQGASWSGSEYTDEFGINNSTGLPNAILNLGDYTVLCSTLTAGAKISIGQLNGTAYSSIGPAVNGQPGPTWVIGGKQTAATINTFAGAILADNSYSWSTLAGTTSLIKLGAGTQILSGQNTYQGSTTISNGTLILADPGAMGYNFGGTNSVYSGNITNLGSFITQTMDYPPFLAGVISGSGSLTAGAGTLYLTAANTYTGYTLVTNGATLFVQTNGSILNSSNIIVANSSYLDFTLDNASPTPLGTNQILTGTGTIRPNSGLTTAFGSVITPSAEVQANAGTMTIAGALTLVSGSSADFALSTLHSGVNDQVQVNGAMTAYGATIHIAAPSTSAILDTTSDYVLFTATSFSGSVNTAPVWDVKPQNYASFVVVTTGNSVKLHALTAGFSLPSLSGAVFPASALRNQTVVLTVTNVPGSNPDPNPPTVNLGQYGGASSVAMSTTGTANVFTLSYTVSAAAPPGVVSLPVTITDGSGLSDSISVPFNVVASTEVWSGLGPDGNWDDNANWASGAAPGYVGDSLIFAGTTGLSPVIDQNYTLAGLSFSNNAGLFNINSSPGSILTILPNAGVTNNNGTNVETLNVPITILGTTYFNAASNNLVISNAIAGSGALTSTATNAAVSTNLVTLGGSNIFTGNIAVLSGTLSIGPGGALNNNATPPAVGSSFVNNIAVSTNATFNYGSTNTETLNGIITGTGNLNAVGLAPYSQIYSNGSLYLPSSNTFTGNITISNEFVSDLNVENVTGPTGGGLGNPNFANRVVTINSNGVLSLDASGGNEFGGGASAPSLAFTVNAGGVMQITSGNATIGTLTLNGGTLFIKSSASLEYEPIELGNNLASGGTAPSLITNAVDGSGAGVNLGVNTSSGQTTITVGSTGSAAADLTVAVPMADGGGIATPGSVRGIIKAGTGRLLVTDQNVYHGITAINAGTLSLGSVENAGTSGPLGVSAAINPGSITFGGGALQFSSVNQNDYSGRFSTASGQLFKFDTAGQNITFATPLASIGGTLTKVGLGVLSLSGNNSYSGATTISNGTLALLSGATISSSSSITVLGGTILDLSQITSPTLGANQALYGLGTINAGTSTLGTSPGVVIAPSHERALPIGRTTINGNLSLVAGASASFALGTTFNSPTNDSIQLNGSLTSIDGAIHIAAPSSSVNLDISGSDYVLIQATGSVTGPFLTAPIWDVPPANSNNFVVLVTANSVNLHYVATTGTTPLLTGAVSPVSALRNQTVVLTVTNTPDSNLPNGTPVVNIAAPFGGVNNVTMTATGSANVYTASYTVPSTAAPGLFTLPVTVADSVGITDTIGLSFTVSTSVEVWAGNGPDSNSDDNANWASGAAPGPVGDSLLFAGTTRLTPFIDQNYSVNWLSFSNNAGAFNITSSPGLSLTFPPSSGITNNSHGSPETLVDNILATGPLTINAASNNLTIGGQTLDNGGALLTITGPSNTVISNAIIDVGGLTMSGTGTATLGGSNTFPGTITINSGGTLALGPGGTLNDTVLAAPAGYGTVGSVYGNATAIAGTLNYGGTNVQTLTGVISGAGSLNAVGIGTPPPTNATLVLTAFNSQTGNWLISNAWVSDPVEQTGSPTTSGLGNMTFAGRVITIASNGVLSLDANGSIPSGAGNGGNEFGPGSETGIFFLLVVNQGGILQNTYNNVTIGSINLNGGEVMCCSNVNTAEYMSFEIGGSVNVAGTAPSLFTNYGPNYTNSGINLGVNTSGTQTGFNVSRTGSAGPDLIMAVAMADAGNIAYGSAANGFTKNGPGTMLLAGTNLYHGITTLNAGTLTLGVPETPGFGGPLGIACTNAGQIQMQGGILQYSAANQTDYSVAFSTAAFQQYNIDTAGQNITFATPLVSSAAQLTKLGAGTLTLTAPESYTGSTTVSNGILALGAGSSLNAASSIILAAGGTFDVSQSSFTLQAPATITASGTATPAAIVGSVSLGSQRIILNYDGSHPALTISTGTLTLNGNAFTVNGAVLPAGTYTIVTQVVGNISSFGALTVSGTAVPVGSTVAVSNGAVQLTVPSTIPTVGTNLVFSVSGSTINFSWPSSYLGFALQSNSVNIASNAFWFPISGSTGVTNESLPILTNGSVFYRMQHP